MHNQSDPQGQSHHASSDGATEDPTSIARPHFLQVVGLAALGLGLDPLPCRIRPRDVRSEIAGLNRRRRWPGHLAVAVDIGTSKICVATLDFACDPTKLLGVHYAPSLGIHRGEIVDPETVAGCLAEALVGAETEQDILIGNVELAISGTAIESTNSKGTANISDPKRGLFHHHVASARQAAASLVMPASHHLLHSVLQRGSVDGQEPKQALCLERGRVFEADFHIIHGPKAQIDRHIYFVEALEVDVATTAFGPIACGEFLLDADQKSRGALLIDMGAGTTDYVLYLDGGIEQSGCLALGGDEVTRDLSIALRVPISLAEKLKIGHGNLRRSKHVVGQNEGVARNGESLRGAAASQELCNEIIRSRLQGIFESLKARLETSGARLALLGAGVHLTGGCALLPGIDDLAREVFGIPAFLARAPEMISGPTHELENPRSSCALGLLRLGRSTYGLWNHLGNDSTDFRFSIFEGRQGRTKPLTCDTGWAC